MTSEPAPDEGGRPAVLPSELADRLSALERELARRDEQLEVRAAVIRRLRRELATVRAERDRLTASPTYRLAEHLRRVALVARPRTLLVFARRLRRTERRTPVGRA